MRLHYIQHVPFENPGVILNWASTRSIDVSFTKMYESELFPDLSQLDFLVVMGGPMSVNEESEFPWMKNEKRFIKNCMDQNKKILGICLGAQMLADVLGAEVSKNKHKVIGWFDVDKTSDSVFSKMFPDKFKAFHWHGECFKIPNGAEKLFQSEACDNQGFIYNNFVGLQFHIESNEESISSMIENCVTDIDESGYVQTIYEIYEGKSNIARNSQIIYDFLDNFICDYSN